MTKMGALAIGAVTLSLAACGSSSDISERNPNYFGAKLKDGVISGSYNPAGFNSKTVQAQIKTICTNERIRTYGESKGNNSLTTFQATCAQGPTLNRAFVEVERMPNGNYSIEVLGS